MKATAASNVSKYSQRLDLIMLKGMISSSICMKLYLRFLQKIVDSSGEKISTLNQMMAFPIKAFSRNAEAIIVMGIDVRKSMETFGDEFELVTAVQTEEGIISLGDDYARYESGLELDETSNFGITNIKGHVDKENSNFKKFSKRMCSKEKRLSQIQITLIEVNLR